MAMVELIPFGDFPEDMSGSDCDWGHCSAPAICMRMSRRQTYLPVCERHSKILNGLDRLDRLAHGIRLNDKEQVDLKLALNVVRRLHQALDLNPNIEGFSWIGIRHLIAKLEEEE